MRHWFGQHYLVAVCLLWGVFRPVMGQEEVGLLFSDTPFRQAVRSASQICGVPILLDRRVDPDQRLDLKLQEVPVDIALERLAEAGGAVPVRIGPLVYFAPEGKAQYVRTALGLCRQQLGKCPAELRNKLLAREEVSWPDFTSPRQLIESLLQSWQVACTNTDAIPHDLWASASLPSLPRIDVLGLLLFQFGLTVVYRGNSGQFEIIALPETVGLTAVYPRREIITRLPAWQSRLLGCRLETNGNTVAITGRIEDHEWIRTQLGRDLVGLSDLLPGGRSSRAQGPQKKPKVVHPSGRQLSSQHPWTDKRFTVNKARGRLGAVLQQLSQGIGFQLEIDHVSLQKAGLSLDQPVEFSVTNATLEQLLDAVLQPLGCAFEIRGRTVRVFAPEVR